MIKSVKQVTLEEKITYLAKIIYLASTFDTLTTDNVYEKLNSAVESLFQKNLEYDVIKKMHSLMVQNNWTQITSNEVSVLVDEVGPEINNVLFGSLVHIHNIMISSAKNYILETYGNAIYKPKYMYERINEAKTAEQMTNLINTFLAEKENTLNTNPVYLIKHIYGKNSNQYKNIIRMDREKGFVYTKLVLKEKFGPNIQLKNCKNVKDIISALEKNGIKITF